MQQFIYSGSRHKSIPHVYVRAVEQSGIGRRLDPRLDLYNHSPDGFEWGYGGSGPAQLALALLAHHCGSDEQLALQYHQAFKAQVISQLDRSGWAISSAMIKHWLVGQIQAAEQSRESA